MALVGMAGGQFSQAELLALAFLVVLTVWLVWQWRHLTLTPSWLIAAAVLITLLVSPYLQNYDYVLLLVPFLVLAGDARGLDWLWLALAFALPVAGLALFGVAGNTSLVLSALTLFLCFARRLTQLSAAPVASGA